MENWKLDLFSDIEEDKRTNSLSVVKLDFIESFNSNWMDLFKIGRASCRERVYI